jgi:hypothetical protein
MIGRRGFTSAILLGGTMLALSGCGENQPGGREVEELRYRLTVAVDTPEGMRSGSSVIEVRAVKNPDWLTPEGRGYRYSFKGEAVAVDLPDGRTLFALLKTQSGASDASEYPWFAFDDRLADTRDPLAQMQRMRGWKGQTAEMTKKKEMGAADRAKSAPELPMLVTFGDLKDPASVKRVDPDDLSASFGAGVKLKAITVEITRDAVTTGIGKRFSWRNNYSLERRRLNGSNSIAISTNELSDNLGTGEFSTGVNQ